MRCRYEHHTLHHTREVAEIEGVVGLGWGRQQRGHGSLVHGGCSGDHDLAESSQPAIISFAKMPVCNAAVDARHHAVVKGVNANNVHVPQEASRNFIASSTYTVKKNVRFGQ